MESSVSSFLSPEIEGAPQLYLSVLERKMEKMQAEINDLHRRNEVKDRGKQFEGSLTRVVILMMITYCTLLGYMIFLGVERPELNAIVPTVGFNLSTWSLAYVKVLWIIIHDNWKRSRQSSNSKDATSSADPHSNSTV